jgi:hypothetical protein
MILTGVALHDPLRIAFFEDPQSGLTIRAGVGQPVSTGVLVSVEVNSIQYQQGGHTLTILVGQTLSGQTPTSTYATTSPSDSPSTSTFDASQPAGQVVGSPKTAAPSGDMGNKSSEDILERLRQRRLQELKR